jgi:peptidoglycan/LPS O-acetylase OafA/YrhL
MASDFGRLGGVTLGDGLRGRDNALNLVRLILASAVVLSHTRPVGGFGPDPVIGGRGLGAWGVAGFFAISGYLICGSRVKLPWQTFVLSRMLRIYPGYWLSLVAVAAVFAAAASAATGTPFDVTASLRFVLLNLAAPLHWSFGEALKQAAHPEAWNAPLWTLNPEMLCYAVAGTALTFMIVRRRAILFTAGASAALIATNVLLASTDRLSDGGLLDFLHLLGFFSAGALAWALRDLIPVRLPLVMLSLAALCAVGFTHATDELANLPLTYLVLAAGAALPTRLAQRRDLSYGLYIFSWPIQTTLYLMGAARHGWVAYCVLTFAITLPVAYLSWTYVEGPALRLRRRLQMRAPGQLTTAEAVEGRSHTPHNQGATPPV